MNTPTELRYAASHEWARQDQDGDVTVGISDYAQDQLGDVVFVETPEAGKSLKKGDSFAVVESVKAASDVYAPASGKVVAVNSALDDAPETINSDPFGEGWIVEIELSNPADVNDLLDATAYAKHCASRE